jgi:hypothetical protein
VARGLLLDAIEAASFVLRFQALVSGMAKGLVLCFQSLMSGVNFLVRITGLFQRYQLVV